MNNWEISDLADKHFPLPEEPVRRNVRAIAQLEQHFLQNRSLATRLGDWIARISGSMAFVVLNALWYAVWIVINVGLIPSIEPFDPYPFTFLTLCVSLEAIFLATFVLMSQNRMSRLDNLRNHLDLQINLLAEEENTKMLQMLDRISQRLGLEGGVGDEELQQLEEETQVETLVQELEESLPNE
jgi:uncharacterized membrane protein